VNRGANVLTKRSKKSKAKQELISSKNQILMPEGQLKLKCRVLNERRGLFVDVLILEYWSRMRSIEDGQEK